MKLEPAKSMTNSIFLKLSLAKSMVKQMSLSKSMGCLVTQTPAHEYLGAPIIHTPTHRPVHTYTCTHTPAHRPLHTNTCIHTRGMCTLRAGFGGGGGGGGGGGVVVVGCGGEWW